MQGLRTHRAFLWASGALAVLTLMASVLLASAPRSASAATTIVLHLTAPGPPAVDVWLKCTVVDGKATDCKVIPPPSPPRPPAEYAGMGFTSGGEPPTGSFEPAAWLVIGLGAALTTGIAAAHRKRRWRPGMPASQTG